MRKMLRQLVAVSFAARPGRLLPTALSLTIALAAAHPGSHAQTASEELDANWINVCPGAQIGTTFFDRCQEILNAGPGSGDRRSAAATGNNLENLGAQGRLARAERQAEESWGFGRYIVSLDVNAGRVEHDGTSFESGFEADSVSVLAGFSYRFSDAFVGGLSLGFDAVDTEFDTSAGSLEADTLSATLTGDFSLSENAFLTTYVGRGDTDFDIVRDIAYRLVLDAGTPQEQTITINGTAVAETDGDRLNAGLVAGFDRVGDTLTLTPVLAARYSDTDIDAYTETDDVGLAVAYGEQSITSLTGSAGLQGSWGLERDWGVLSPSFRIEYVHEFDDDERAAASRFVGDVDGSPLVLRTEEPDRNYGLVGFGITAVRANGVIWFVDIGALVGHEFLSEYTIAAGLQLEL